MSVLALAGKGRGVLLCSLSVFWVIAGVLLTSRCLGGIYIGVYECTDIWQPGTRWWKLGRGDRRIWKKVTEE